MRPFPPHVLREYALLADGERGALVGPRGDIAFLCAPRWHDEAVFTSLLGGSGYYAVTPVDTNMVWGGYYRPGSLVWHDRWVTSDAIIQCRSALAYPGNPDRAVLLRQVQACDGPARVELSLDLRAGYGHEAMTDLHRDDAGVWTGRSGGLRFRWCGAADAAVQDGRLHHTLEIAEGQQHELVLEIGARLPDEPVQVAAAWSATLNAWDTDAPDLSATAAPADARQSYAVLRGLTSSTGAMVAAATMGLPERARSGSSYDYRYAWIRDQCYAGQAVGAIGPSPLLAASIRFVTERVLADGDRLKPAYRIDGGLLPDEETLDLPGYPGGTPVRGNWVNDQFQLDAPGEALLLFATAARHDLLDLDQWRAVETLTNIVEKRAGEPDNGIWELDPARWAHSRLMCAAGLRAIAGHAPASDGARWTTLADRLVADTAADCLHPTGRWQRAADDARVDAALLLPGLRGAVPADDPRTLATYRAVRDELADDGFCYRFRHDRRPLEQAEGAFLLCGFLLALTAHQHGDQVAAARWFERNRTAYGTPGLYTEEYDVAQHQLRGNLPQAFVHALMLETSVRLGKDHTP